MIQREREHRNESTLSIESQSQYEIDSSEFTWPLRRDQFTNQLFCQFFCQVNSIHSIPILRSSISILLRSNNSIFMFMLLLLLLSVKNNIKNLNHQILSSFINWWYFYFYYSMTSLLWWQFLYSMTIHLFKNFLSWFNYLKCIQSIHFSKALFTYLLQLLMHLLIYPKYCIQSIKFIEFINVSKVFNWKYDSIKSLNFKPT